MGMDDINLLPTHFAPRAPIPIQVHQGSVEPHQGPIAQVRQALIRPPRKPRYGDHRYCDQPERSESPEESTAINAASPNGPPSPPGGRGPQGQRVLVGTLD